MGALRTRTAQLLEAQRPDDPWGRVVDVLLIVLIFANVIVVVLETDPALDKDWSGLFWRFEIFSVAVFTIEYALRLWSCVDEEWSSEMSATQARLRWAASPLGLIDLLAILPFYIFLFIPGGGESLLLLRIFRGLRLIRLFKLSRYSPALGILRTVLLREANTLVVVAFVMLLILVMASWGVFMIERDAQPEAFGSLPQALWWSVVTLTTVGYGDVVPVTPLGKFFGGIVSLVGIGMAALPAGILASGFSTEMRRREAVFYREVKRAAADGDISDEEQERIQKLAKSLGLGHREQFALTRDVLRDRHGHNRCPHCGGDLEPLNQPSNGAHS
jgi:voltage-gated potassium channel